MSLEQRLSDMVQPLVEDLGCEFVGLELSGPRHALLRIYIDRAIEGGVTLEDCEKVSREVAALLDVEDPIQSSYRLEVSSPGVDRPLFSPEQYASHCGEQVKLALHMPVVERRRLQGTIDSVDGDTIVILYEDDQRLEIPFSNIARGRIMPDYEALLRGQGLKKQDP